MAIPSLTRAEIRRMVGNMLGDVTELVATANGTATTFIDTINLSSNIEGPRNRDIVFPVSDVVGNQYMVRRVTHYDLNAGWVAFDALSGITTLDDVAEMYNFRGKGWRISEYNSAINQAIRETRGLYKEQDWDGIPAVNVVSSSEINIDLLGYDYISGVDYLSGSTYLSIPAARSSTANGWWIENATALRVNGYPVVLNSAENDSIRIQSWNDAAVVDDDSDAITIPPEWLTNRVASILCMSALDRDQGNFARANNFQREATMNLASIRTRVPSTLRPVNK